jgi:hypothetical protein
MGPHCASSRPLCQLLARVLHTDSMLPCLMLGALALNGCRSHSSGSTEWTATCTSGPAPVELSLERAYPIEPGAAGLPFDTSGLLLFEGQLLAISDKHDDTIFSLSLGPVTADARAFIRLTTPSGKRLDLEGLASGRDGSFWLASEAENRVLRVTRSGELLEGPGPLQPIFAAAGLCGGFNAGLEGAALLDDGRLLLAAEREPRGLVELDPGADVHGARAWVMESARCPARAPRNNDFGDITTFDHQVYALERNAHLVVRLERSHDGWLERDAWSYAQTENDPRFSYEEHKFGLAEGLALDAEHVYVALDNNHLARSADALDRRPQLFVFRRPR